MFANVATNSAILLCLFCTTDKKKPLHNKLLLLPWKFRIITKPLHSFSFTRVQDNPDTKYLFYDFDVETLILEMRKY